MGGAAGHYAYLCEMFTNALAINARHVGRSKVSLFY